MPRCSRIAGGPIASNRGSAYSFGGIYRVAHCNVRRCSSSGAGDCGGMNSRRRRPIVRMREDSHCPREVSMPRCYES
jgi:hypothetical protein